ncbi:g3829 [Coccomyxa viridis]|uniref:G3829 protein n=1 Tax=Coccomyxa viridis TaxID=1274662 RepID=A0ABP1FR36_9CHLO
MPFLSARGLSGLKNYKYQSAGYTLLDDIHQPFWNWITEQLPLWLAPNLITLIGTFGLILAYFVSLYHVPTFTEVAPWWVYFLNGFAGLVYLHLDCIDGKQARRTKSSSPLGQLFDHGCDALTVHLAVTTIGTSIAVGFTPWCILGVMTIMGPWMLAHWEEYHSGIMLYGNGYWGVTEANYLMIALHFFTAAVGPGFWGINITQWIKAPLPWPIQDGLLLKHVLLLSVFCCGVQQFSGQMWRIFAKGMSGMMPEEERGHKQLGRAQALSHLAQLGLTLLLGILVMAEPWPTVSAWRAVYGGFGVLYALQASKLIMDHMAKEPFEIFWMPILALVMLLAFSRAAIVSSEISAWTFAGLMVAFYLHYVTSAISEICAFLGIKCLTIKPRTD